MNTMFPKVLQNITIITIIIYCKKQICWTTEAISPLPHCLVYACTFFLRHTNSFADFSFLFPWRVFSVSLYTFLKWDGEWVRGGNRKGKSCVQAWETCRTSVILPVAVCATLGCHIWVRPPSLVQAASCEILQGVLFNINMVEKEMDFENIWFRRCGMVDNTLPSKTAEQRFISSAVGLKHSQTSWHTLTALMRQNYTWDLTTCACLGLYFFSDTNLQWKVMVKGSSVDPLPTQSSCALLLPRASGVQACWCTWFNQTSRATCADRVCYLSTLCGWPSHSLLS